MEFEKLEKQLLAAALCFVRRNFKKYACNY